MPAIKLTIKRHLLIMVKKYYKHITHQYVLKFKYVCYTVLTILHTHPVIPVTITNKWLTIL